VSLRLVVTAGGLALFAIRAAAAQSITIDGSLSPARTLAGPNYTIGAGLGRQFGGNLFHSFGSFSLNTGESANFTGPATVANIVGRVTGGNPSSIDGNIRSSIAGANLYLINPSGIVFGPNATVNVSGSFHAASADYVRMSDGARFQATNPGGSTFSPAPPAAFGFLGPTPAAIAVNGSTLGPVPGVLGLAGGPVTITGATLTAPGGTIQVTSAAGPGEVVLDPAGSALTVTTFGRVAITGGAKLAVSDPQGQVSGGSVAIRAGALSIDASEIDADNYGAGPGGQVLLQADRRITATGGATIHALAKATGRSAAATMLTGANGTISIDSGQVLTEADGTGAAGDITVATGNLTILNGGFIGSNTTGAGNAGSVRVTVGGPLTIDGQSASGFTGITSQTHGTGSAQAVSVDAGTLSIANTGEISGATFGAGRGSDVSVNVKGALSIADGFIDANAAAGSSGNAGNVAVAAGTISIAGGGEISGNTFGMGTGGDLTVRVRNALSLSIGGQITTDSENPNSGNAGRITVSADSLSITTDGLISSGTFGAGSAGDVMVRVAGRLSIDGTNANPRGGPTSILSQAEMGKGNAGRVTVLAGDLSIVGGGEISGDTFSAGRGGDVSVKVTGVLAIANGFIIADGEAGSTGNAGNVTVKAGAISVNQGGMIASDAVGATTHKAAATGNAGTVNIAAGTLSIASNGEISSGTSGPGNAGDVTVRVANRLAIDGSAATANNGPTGILSQANTGSTGNAGDVTLSAGDLSIAANGDISSTTFGAGRGGNVLVAVADQLTIVGTTANSGATGIEADTDGGGHAGNAVVTAKNISISDNGEISSSSGGTGFSASGSGGDVSVTATDALLIVGGNPQIGATGIFAQANGGSTGNAGNVTVSAGDLSIVSNGGISSTTFGSGNGGNVSVAVADQLTIVGTTANASATGIEADTNSSGHAGNVVATAKNISVSNNGEISSNSGSTGFSASGSGGDVFVTATGALSIVGGNPQVGATGILAQANRGSTGNAGNVTVSAGDLSIASNGGISSTTFGSGDGGRVSVAVSGTLAVDATSANPQFQTGISAQTNLGSSGAGGDVRVTASAIVLSGSAQQIAAFSSGSGAAGTVSVTAGTLEILDHAGISTAGAAAKGGDVTLSIGDLLYLRGGEITTSSQGVASNGGNITIVSPLVALANASRIDANAFGGNGGNIRIAAGSFLASADSAVTASSQTGIAGMIAITGQQAGLNGSLVVLPGTLRGVPVILADSCAARGARSSLTEGGRGGLPQDPETVVPSLYIAGSPPQAAQTSAAASNIASPLRSTLDLRAGCG
jgi:filamentous hemagglutinin family protein